MKHTNDYQVNNNSFSDFHTALGVYESENSATVGNNEILNNTFNDGIQYDKLQRFGKTGIEIENTIAPSKLVTVSGNTIYNCENGIHGIGVNRITIGTGNSSFNTIEDQSPAPDFTLPFTPHYGIWLQNTNDADIFNNTVSWTGG